MKKLLGILGLIAAIAAVVYRLRAKRTMDEESAELESEVSLHEAA